MMAQYNAAKNPPWARDPSIPQPGVANMQPPQVGLANTVMSQQGMATSTVYSIGNQQPTMAPHQYSAQQMVVPALQVTMPNAAQAPPAALQTAVQLPQPGIAIPTTLATTQVATISYPTPRSVTPGGQPQQPPKQQRVFTGTVTKLHDNFGFVDEDVFFQTSCVKGIIPKVGDRVLVEASYNANMPFKWNAARIQVLPNQITLQPSVAQNQNNFNPANQSGFNPSNQPGFNPPNQPGFNPNPIPYQVKAGMGSGMTPPVLAPSTMSQPPPLMGQQTQPTVSKRDNKGLLQAPPGRPVRRMENQGFRDRERVRDRDRERHSHDRRERRSPRKRSRSPRRSKSPSVRSRSPQRRRQQARIVPRYMVQVPKLSLDCKSANVISLRSRYTNLYIPSDFFNTSFTWVDAFPLHRPFQLGNSCMFHVMSKDVEPLNKLDTQLEPSDADHLYSAKVMLLSIPALEEIYHKSCGLTEDPGDVKETFQHPTRLVQFLVGMKGKSEPMAIGGPWSPSLDGADPRDDPRVLINTAIRTTRALTGIDLSRCTQWYRFAEIRYHRPEELHKGRTVPARAETVVIFLPDVWSCGPTRLEWEQTQAAYKKQLQDKLAEEAKDERQEEEEDGADGESGASKDPTHFSDLDPKSMKVADLRKELEARTLSSRGLKSQLIARLTKSMKSEQEKEEQELGTKEEQDEQKVLEEEKKAEVDEKEDEQRRKEEEERRKKEERDKVVREKKFNLPENPAVIVHPSPTAKSGKFDCTVMSLSVLLDYRPEDNKEHSFEVSLFAELYNEMLMRDFGFHIYKALFSAPEPKKEEDKKEKDKEKEKEREKDKDKDKDKEKEKEREKEKEHKDEKDKETPEEPSVKKRKTSQEGEEKQEEKEVKKEPREDKKEEKEIKKEPREDKKEEKEKEKDRDQEVDSKDGEEDEEPDEDHRDKDKDRHRNRDKDKKRDKPKFFTANRDLLLAFVYFDQNHTGYLLDKDLEEIMYTLGLQLSRAQVKKLVQKLVSRDTLNYRKLTDKPQTLKDGEKEGEIKEEAMEVSTDKEANEDATIAQGNLPFLEAHQSIDDRDDEELSPKSKKVRKEREDNNTSESSGLFMYNGAMIDINSVMQRLERSEKTRAVVEVKLKEVQEEMDITKTSFSSSQQNGQKVAIELQELKKKLRDQKRQNETTETGYRKLQDIVNKSKNSLLNVVADMRSVSGECELLKKEEIKKESVNGE